jgi:hypothetical protein
MKSDEVYKLLKSEVGPWFKAAGFKRAKNMLSWYRSHGEDFVVIWFQVSQDGWDEYAGSKFTMEFQKSSTAVVGAGRSRKRISCFCSASEREAIRLIQNGIVRSLEIPPKSHFAFHVSPQVTEWYKEKFLSESTPYQESHDIWFRYSKPDHVLSWGKYLVAKLPDCVSAVEAWV